MPLPLQVKLLRVLQEKKIQRLGSTQSIPIDIRIIAATNKDLKSLIQKGTFREDLFFRLNVIHISMPPLRDRLDDIPLFIGHCLKTNGEKLNKGDLSIEQEAVDLMLQYSYPGNIRELENIMERAAILCDTNIIRTSDLEILAPSKKTKQVRGTLAEIEKEVVIETLERWQGNRTKASEELGITRMTLINKIKEYSIDMQKTDISAINSD